MVIDIEQGTLYGSLFNSNKITCYKNLLMSSRKNVCMILSSVSICRKKKISNQWTKYKIKKSVINGLNIKLKTFCSTIIV